MLSVVKIVFIAQLIAAASEANLQASEAIEHYGAAKDIDEQACSWDTGCQDEDKTLIQRVRSSVQDGLAEHDLGKDISSVTILGQDVEATVLAEGVPSQIPYRLILVAKEESMDQVKSPYVIANVKRVLERNPGITVRWLGDRACEDYLRTQWDDELAGFFVNETHGPYKSDICRAGVMSREGGFYVDLDLDPVLKFAELIDEKTTFMSAYCSNGFPDRPLDQWCLLNALMACTPNNKIMAHNLEQIRNHYQGNLKTNEGQSGPFPMGPTALLEGLIDTMSTNCAGSSVESKRNELQWPCGEEYVRLFHEDKLHCGDGYSANECPLNRKMAAEPVQYGIFAGMGPSRTLVAWTRFAECTALGCNQLIQESGPAQHQLDIADLSEWSDKKMGRFLGDNAPDGPSSVKDFYVEDATGVARQFAVSGIVPPWHYNVTDMAFPLTFTMVMAKAAEASDTN